MRPLGVLVGDRLDLLGDPGVVGLDQAELAELVVAVRVEAGARRRSSRGAKRVERARSQFSSISARTAGPRVYGGTGTLIMLVAQRHGAAVGIERMLEEARHQHPLVAGEMSSVPLPWWTSKSTIATRSRPRTSSAWRAATATLLKKQKPIAWSRRRVVAGRAHRAEGVVDVAVDHRVGRRHGGAGGAQHRVPGAGRQRRVGVERARPAVGGDPLAARSRSSAT